MTETVAWKFVYDKKLAVTFPASIYEVCVERRLLTDNRSIAGYGDTIQEAVENFIFNTRSEINHRSSIFRDSIVEFAALLPEEENKND